MTPTQPGDIVCETCGSHLRMERSVSVPDIIHAVCPTCESPVQILFGMEAMQLAVKRDNW